MAELDLSSMLFVLMLSTFVGFQVIQNVSRLLHTPLMSLTNAISAIAVVGAILVAGGDYPRVDQDRFGAADPDGVAEKRRSEGRKPEPRNRVKGARPSGLWCGAARKSAPRRCALPEPSRYSFRRERGR